MRLMMSPDGRVEPLYFAEIIRHPKRGDGRRHDETTSTHASIMDQPVGLHGNDTQDYRPKKRPIEYISHE
jgi:hypothetical protein